MKARSRMPHAALRSITSVTTQRRVTGGPRDPPPLDFNEPWIRASSFTPDL